MNRQFSVTPDQVLRKRFSAHRFVVSPVGILKLLATLFLLIGSIISLSAQVCSTSNTWLEIVFPTVTAVSGVVVALLYASSILGLAQRIPNIWANVDILLSIIISIISLVISILLLSNCSSYGAVSKVPGILGIIGAALLIVSSAIIFITWRSAEDDAIEIPSARSANNDKRPSVTMI